MSDALSTGMGSLDTKFRRGGFVPGSVVAVQAPPAALGRVVLYNLAAGRPTTYLPVGPVGERRLAVLREAGDLEAASLTVEQLPGASPGQALQALLDTLELPPGGTVLVEPVDPVETDVSRSQYATLLSMLARRANEADGLVGLLAVDRDTTPDHRWLTLHEADTVLTLLHEVSTRSVRDHVALEKLHPEQELRDDERVFRLPRSLEIDIDTKQNLSP